MKNIKLKVNWLNERPDDNDDNEGKYHGERDVEFDNL